MTKEWIHPTVRRSTIWWKTQIAVVAALIVSFVMAAFWEPSMQLTLTAVIVVLIGALLIFMATKQIKTLRHEYRYDEEHP